MDQSLTTVGEWQNFLSANFPGGCLATRIKYSEEAAKHDDSIQVLISGFVVIEVENEVPTISMRVAGEMKDVLVEISDFEERDYGMLAVTANDAAPNWMLSRNMTDTQKEIIKTEKDRGSVV